MSTIFANLINVMEAQDCTQRELAKRMGISLSALNLKINGHRNFDLWEMRAIQSILRPPTHSQDKRKVYTLDYLFFDTEDYIGR